MYKVDILLLFEHTGLAAKCFTDVGFTVCIVDMLNTTPNPWATHTLNWNILEREDDLKEIASTAKLVFGMPPCTDLAGSGAGHFAAKYKVNPSFQIEALHLFKSVPRIAGDGKWGAENPSGVISTKWRKPDFYFDPYEYGAYLPEEDIHPLYPEYIAPRDAYPKNTGIWCGNGFKKPPTKSVRPEPGYSRQHKKLGGKSQKTKTIRSASPRGFFTALAIQEYKNENNSNTRLDSPINFGNGC